MSVDEPIELDFPVLDDIAFAAERRRLDRQRLPPLLVHRLGPLIELALLAEDGRAPSPWEPAWLAQNSLGALSTALQSGAQSWLCPASKDTGFLRTNPAQFSALTTWTGFGLAGQQAAQTAGFPKPVATQLAAALGELYSNIWEHSGLPESGLIVFRATPGAFEFTVADRGIGVLESLCTSKDHAILSDHGTALELTLRDGVSRYGTDEGRGHGFRPLFIGLTNLRGALRFRSGDHALTIDGQSPSLMSAQTSQKVPLTGFFASVRCHVSHSL